MAGTMGRLWSRRRMLGTAARGVLAGAVLGGVGWFTAFRAGRAEAACLRPPGALAEPDFLSTCIRCGRCADACPNRCITAFTEETGKEAALVPGSRQWGTPIILPRRQACMLCNGVEGEHLQCTAACPTGALQLIKKDHASISRDVDMGTAEVDTNLCYSFNGASCGVCVRACPLEGEALSAGLWEKPLVDPDRCVGCGLCERSCVRYPHAIRVRPRNSDHIALRGAEVHA